MATRKKRLIIGITAAVSVLALLAVGTALGLNWFADRQASAAFDDARTAVQAAQLDHETALSELALATEAATAAHATGTALNSMTSSLLLADPEVKPSLTRALAELATVAELPEAETGDVEEAEDAEETGRAPEAETDSGALEVDLRAPAGREALLAAAAELRAQIPAIRAATAELSERTSALQTATVASRAAAVALVQSAHEKALAFETPSLASEESRGAYEQAVDALAEPEAEADLVVLMQAYEDTWHAVVVSNEAGVRARGYDDVTPTYLRGVLIVNKTYPLPADYGEGLTAETMQAWGAMRDEAAAKGLNLYISSGFRSYWTQKSIWDGIANSQGAAVADLDTARPGHSEHQSGLTFDLNSISESFAYTAEGQWVRDNAHRFGFVIRYPQGKTDITGYIWEPWHMRYLGVELATELHDSGLTLEEYLGVTSRYS